MSKKESKKAANIAAYEARCKRLQERSKAANEARKAGFVGRTDIEVLAAAQHAAEIDRAILAIRAAKAAKALAHTEEINRVIAVIRSKKVAKAA